ncbi:hypothetical protein [Cytobacillus dafuensis]|uniref:Sucrose phosphatase-like domain-containing protein n=1 Tax=Cytobacillus dafuensis TaxID=1742359 RepID=A0A5B8Z5X0_CYTDA|nr:hypothetical protein [Cytobacillus dafuensis]QED48328.1 hypothetical protein FSZ17_14360 [Cytobacillus dafuensis]
MLMFASDLDRTLIYSERALTEFRQIENDDLIGVERKDEQDVAFMSKKSFESLLEITKKMLFVPVTTRTSVQYNRIHILTETIPLTYAVTSNGANIFHNGAPLLEWNRHVRKRLEIECASLAEMTAVIKTYNIEGLLKIADNLFFYFLLEKGIDLDTVKSIKEMASKYGWRISIQGRKLYFMPMPISKGEAVKFIKARESINTAFGAGDSLLDDDFLRQCDYSFVPSHGELAKEENINKQYIITKKWGVKAGEEILLEINEMAKNRIYSG